METLLIPVALVVAATLLVRLQQRVNLLQYVFFLRVPLLAAVAMVFLPLVADRAAPALIRNWFELGFAGLAITTALTLLLSWTVMYAGAVIYVNTPARTRLPFLNRRPGDDGTAERSALTPVPRLMRSDTRFVTFALLGAPILITCWNRSVDLAVPERLLALLFGVLAALAFVETSDLWRRHARARSGAEDAAGGAFSGLLATCRRLTIEQALSEETRASMLRGYEREHDSVFTRARARFFLLMSVALYALGVASMPGWWPGLGDVIPALAYVVVLVMLLTWLLSGASFFLDRYRMPLLLAVVALAALNYDTARVDHFYELEGKPGARLGVIDVQAAVPEVDSGCRDGCSSAPLTPRAAIEAWQQRNPGDGPMLVVAASGGGIKASAWTALVMTELQHRLGEEFARSVVAISAVSGGTLGAMHYVDAYDADAPPDVADIARFREMAMRSSLGAVGWGIVYADFWRPLLPIAVPALVDRGWALERRWGEDSTLAERRLSEWREGVREGWRPALLFNATVQETGRRAVIAPLDLDPIQQAVERHDHGVPLLGPGDDLRVTTAARLSATFPYVTPTTRAVESDGLGAVHRQHIADGGYYDNYGVMGALDFLRRGIAAVKAGGRDVVLVEIRASRVPGADAAEVAAAAGEDDGSPGFFGVITGPMETLLSVRSSSQVERNELARRLLERELLQPSGLRLSTVVFDLDIDSSLSWHLSRREKAALLEALETDAVRASSEVLAGYLGINSGRGR